MPLDDTGFGDEPTETGNSNSEKESPAIPENKTSSSAEEMLSLVMKKLEEQSQLAQRLKSELDKMKESRSFSENLSLHDIEAMVKRQVSVQQHNPRPVEPDDPDDYLETPIMFYKIGAFSVIASDRRNGQEVFPPRSGTDSNGLIVFRMMASRRKISGRQEEITHISSFKCHSKKLAKWIRDTQEYQTFQVFEEMPDESVAGNAAYAKRMVSIMGGLKLKSMTELVGLCRTFSLSPSQDQDSMVTAIANKMIEAEFVTTATGAKVPRQDYERTQRLVGHVDNVGLLAADQLRSRKDMAGSHVYSDAASAPKM